MIKKHELCNFLSFNNTLFGDLIRKFTKTFNEYKKDKTLFIYEDGNISYDNSYKRSSGISGKYLK